jgi:rhamnose transport system permease protein
VKQALIRVAGLRASTAVAMLLLVLVINGAISPFFLEPFNLSNVATAAVEVGLLALPATLLIVAGEIDLSIASTLALSSAVLAVASQAGAPWYVAVLAALITGALAGLTNGLLITKLGLSSIIVTIATLALFRGLTEVMLGDQTIQGLPDEITGWNLQYLGGSLITWPQVFLLIVTAGFALLLSRTPAGRTVRLIGAARDVARFSGVGVARSKVMLFVLSGFMSAVAGIFLVSRLQAVRNDIGMGLELVAITVVLIGGTDLRGGRGTIWGTLFALGVVGAVRSGLRLAGVPDQVGLAIVGALLIAAILIARLRDRFESTIDRQRSGPANPSSEAAEPPGEIDAPRALREK